LSPLLSLVVTTPTHSPTIFMLKNGPLSFTERKNRIQPPSRKSQNASSLSTATAQRRQKNHSRNSVFEMSTALEAKLSATIQEWKLPDLSEVFTIGGNGSDENRGDNESVESDEDFDWRDFLRRDFFGTQRGGEHHSQSQQSRKSGARKARPANGRKRCVAANFNTSTKVKRRRKKIRDWTGKAMCARPRINAHLHPWMNVPSLWRIGSGESVRSMLRNEYLEKYDEVHCTADRIYLFSRKGGGSLLDIDYDETERVETNVGDFISHQDLDSEQLVHDSNTMDEECQVTSTSSPQTPSISSISCGDAHSCVILSNGTMFTKGQNNCNQCCLFSSDPHRGHNLKWVHEWTRVKSVSNVSRAFCATRCTIIELKDGALFACGDNTGLRLGVNSPLGGTISQLSSVKGLPECKNSREKRVQKVSVGYHHTMILLQDGSLYAAGTNAFGCTVLNDHAPFVSVFHPVDLSLLPSQLVDITCGQGFTLLLLENGNLFGVGKNIALGLGESGVNWSHIAFTEITVPPSIRDEYRLGSGDRFSLLVSQDTCACCGENDQNQLGKHERYIDVPSLQFENASQLPMNDTPILSFCVSRKGFLLFRKTTRSTPFENAWCCARGCPILFSDCVVSCGEVI